MLKEETLRGLTINLGFAYLIAANLALLTCLDTKNLYIIWWPAGGGSTCNARCCRGRWIMPQTREHLEILSLIGLKSGCVVITKTDRADEDRLSAVTSM